MKVLLLWGIPLVLLTTLPGVAYNQPFDRDRSSDPWNSADSGVSSLIWMRYTWYPESTESVSGYVYFGNHLDGTACADSINPTLVERLCPPDGCNIEWQAPTSSVSQCYGNGGGFIGFDIRGIPSSPAIPDTFKLSFFDGLGPHSIKWVFYWPDSASLRARCDSLFIVDRLGGTDKTDLFHAESLGVYFGDSLVSDRFTIYKYGARLVEGVNPQAGSPSRMGELEQNYPNPVNGEAGIRYRLSAPGWVKLKVFDVLGREVSRLVDGREGAGIHDVRWNADGCGSGVYFYRLQAGGFVETRKVMVVR